MNIRVLTKEEAKKIDVEFIYNRGNGIGIFKVKKREMRENE